jgi:hypothetical protein
MALNQRKISRLCPLPKTFQIESVGKRNQKTAAKNVSYSIFNISNVWVFDPKK